MRLSTAVLFLCATLAALAPARAGIAPVTVEEIVFQQASLTVAGPAGERSFDQAALEALGTHALTTVTPWREAPATFVGVLLSDVLAANGLADVAAIRVTAENGFAVIIPRAVWTTYPCLIATRVDGKAHSRRARGPLQFVFDMSGSPAVGDILFEQNWVWMAQRIDVAE
jgi:hypothetical protein